MPIHKSSDYKLSVGVLNVQRCKTFSKELQS